MDSDRRASDALFDRLVARLVPVVMDAGADGRRVFYVPSPDAPDPVIADVARAWADLRRDS